MQGQSQAGPAAVRAPFARFCLAAKMQLNVPVPEPAVVAVWPAMIEPAALIEPAVARRKAAALVPVAATKESVTVTSPPCC